MSEFNDVFDTVGIALTVDKNFDEAIEEERDKESSEITKMVANTESSVEDEIEDAMEDSDIDYDESYDDAIDTMDVDAEDYRCQNSECPLYDDADGELIDNIMDEDINLDEEDE